MKVEELSGVGPVNAVKLRQAAEITTPSELLDRCATIRGRRDIKEKTGIKKKVLLDWVKTADLFRIKGLGPHFSELLKQTGVSTVRELRYREGNELLQKMKALNEERRVTRRQPTLDLVRHWIDQSRRLVDVVEFPAK
ncbi:hypothetical protein CBR_g30772 [Chara braunii]|uniref:DUF4332 domain-containing protein n=1 Tax=Chara braunii TaxID=69332 RepID=A0A388JXI4_CHABU|nr:hypothetical protein CBR_g30772 [Chara braunii]|eukprot:GBG62452.1 hypothetical protein CBR_g30772 [Chara braunii]